MPCRASIVAFERMARRGAAAVELKGDRGADDAGTTAQDTIE